MKLWPNTLPNRVSSLFPFLWELFSLSAFHYSLTSCLIAKRSVITTEIGPEETFIDLGTRISKEHGLQGQLVFHAPGEAKEVQKIQGSQRVRAVFPDHTLFNIGVIPDKKPVEAEAPVGTEGQANLFIRENPTTDDAEQDNVIL